MSVNKLENDVITTVASLISSTTLFNFSTSIFEPDSINYCLSINVHKSMHNLCQAFGSVAKKSCPQFDLNTLLKSTKQDDIKKVDISKGNVLCTGFKTQQMLRGMRPNTMYFLDLFAIHTKQNNFTFRLDSQQVWFNRSRPVPLVEGKWATSELASLGGFAVFSYKVTEIFWGVKFAERWPVVRTESLF